MNRRSRQLVIEAFRLIRISAEEGEKLAREITLQDIGPASQANRRTLTLLRNLAETLAIGSGKLLEGIEQHAGASPLLEEIRRKQHREETRAKPLPRRHPGDDTP